MSVCIEMVSHARPNGNGVNPGVGAVMRLTQL